MGKSTGARDRARGRRIARKAEKRAEKKSKKNSTTKKGLAFELRAARAIAQIKPELDVSHNKRLVTEPGHRRQFDVIGCVNDALSHTYEARDHERKVDTGQIDAFETKNATLKEKPRVAGIISAHGFWEKPIDWVRFYRDPKNEQKYVQELYRSKSIIRRAF